MVHVPCPLGWVYKTELTIEVAKIAVLTGLFPIVEIEYGKIKRVRKVGKNRRPVEDYLSVQGRFKHVMTESGKEELEKIRQIAQANIDRYGLE
jgi:pyruvate ferredoxin oxidoreductase beta subunit